MASPATTQQPPGLAGTQQQQQQQARSWPVPDEETRLRQERIARRIQAYFLHFLFLFQAVTQIYVTEYYLLDLAFSAFSVTVRSALRVWAWHQCLVGFVNWVCILWYSRSSDYVPDKDKTEAAARVANTDHTSSQSTVVTTAGNNQDQQDSSSVPIPERTPLPWTFCKKCQMATPPRTRHCKKCERCVVRRDHHCELVGCCIGHRNQRFFVVLASYGIVVTYFGAYMSVRYLYHNHPEDGSLWDYFFPVTIVLWLTGEVSGLQFLLTYHAMMLIIFIPLTTVYFLSEMSVILQGKTMREVTKQMKHIKVTTSVKDNLRIAFGDYWYLNFLFPLHLVFPQKHNGMDFEGVTIGPEPVKHSQPSTDKKQI